MRRNRVHQVPRDEMTPEPAPQMFTDSYELTAVKKVAEGNRNGR